MSIQYRGDLGKFRKALSDSGFKGHAESMIFNDVAKVRGYRRLKLWHATAIQEAPQAAQHKLADAVKKEFGDRFISMYLSKHGGMWGGWGLCVRVKP